MPENNFMEVLFLSTVIKYKSEVKTVSLGGGRTIQIENLTPILTPKEREQRKREIESQLYDVFSKYQNKEKS